MTALAGADSVISTQLGLVCAQTALQLLVGPDLVTGNTARVPDDFSAFGPEGREGITECQ